MSLDNAMRVALSGLRVGEEGIFMSSLNISNADNPDYAKRVMKLKSLNPYTEGGGVEIAAVIRNVVPYWSEEVRNQSSYSSYSAKISDYLQKVQVFQGIISTNQTVETALTSHVNELMNSLKDLTTNAEDPSLMRKVTFSANRVSHTINYLASHYENLRLQTDQDLQTSFNSINQTLKTLHGLNTTIRLQSEKDETLSILEEKRENLIKSLSQEIDIKLYHNNDNSIFLTTAAGSPILNENLYQIEYTPLSMVEQFIENQKFDDTKVYYLDQNTNRKTLAYTLIEGGTSNEVFTKESSEKGRVQALLHLRDELLPTFTNQLDLLANTITHKFNKIQNTGTGFPGMQTIQAAKAMSLNEERIYEGTIRIGVVDKDGRSINYKPDETGFSRPCYPLDLNFNNLNTGKGAGFIDIQTIINEINEYFYYAPVLSRTELGNIEDIKIAATKNLSSTPNGIFSFDFELSNKSQENCSFEVKAIRVLDNSGTLVPGALTSGLPSEYLSLSGERKRTGQEIVVDFGPTLGTGPYTIEAELQVTNENGEVYHSFVNYVVDDTPPTPPGINVRNNRYTVSSFKGDAILHPPVSTQRFAKAKLVDLEGKEITANGVPGYILIEAASENYYLSFDDLTSKEKGRPDQNSPAFLQGVAATNHGFGHFIGLNDFFVKHHEIKSSAIKMTVRKEILDNEALVSRGRLTRDPSVTKNVKVGTVVAEGMITFMGQPTAGDIITINGEDFTFRTVAGATNEITIGADLPTTISNIVFTLNAVNSSTIGIVDKANYLSNGLDSLMISSKLKGQVGNNFTLGATLSVPAKINDSPFSTVPVGTLLGGADDIQQKTFQPWSYGIGEGSNIVIGDFADLAINNFDFEAYGDLPTTTASLSEYATKILLYSASETTRVKIINEQQTSFLNAALTRYKDSAGINLNIETFEITKYQQYYASCAKILAVVNELYKELMKAF